MRQVRLRFTMSQKLVGLQIVFKTPVIKGYVEYYRSALQNKTPDSTEAVSGYHLEPDFLV